MTLICASCKVPSTPDDPHVLCHLKPQRVTECSICHPTTDGKHEDTCPLRHLEGPNRWAAEPFQRFVDAKMVQAQEEIAAGVRDILFDAKLHAPNVEFENLIPSHLLDKARAAQNLHAGAWPTAAEAARLGAIVTGPGEVRVVDERTGAEKGSKLARFDLLPWPALHEVAEHFGRGALKYEDRNWERGYNWSLSFAALHRHLAAWWGREDFDEETTSHHLAAVAWHALALLTFKDTFPEGDNRPKGS
jgi:hypothetical protein